MDWIARGFAFAAILACSGCANPAPGSTAIRSPEASVSVAAPPEAARPVPSSGPAAPVGQNPGTGDLPEQLGPEKAESAPVAAAEGASSGARGWLGVELEPAGPGEAGVRIARVVPRSPAEKSGLLAGDIVQRLDNEPMSAPSDVIAAVSSRRAGGRVGVMLRRGSRDRLLAVTLGSAPERAEIYRMGFVDQAAPQFEALDAAKGNLPTTLGAHRGHVLVVEFWAPFCVACRALIPHMNEWHSQYAARGLRVMGITMEPVARAASAATELGIDYPVFSDANGKTTMAYQARAIPAVFVIDRTGTVRDVMVGYDAPRLAKLDQLVNRLIAER